MGVWLGGVGKGCGGRESRHQEEGGKKEEIEEKERAEAEIERDTDKT